MSVEIGGKLNFSGAIEQVIANPKNQCEKQFVAGSIASLIGFKSLPRQ